MTFKNLGSLNTNRDWDTLLYDLEEELRKWSGVDYVLPFKGDSIRWGEVRLTLTINGHEKTITCERFSERPNGQEANLLALLQVVKATRLADQRGIGSLLAEVSSMLALEAYDPWRVLGATEGDKEGAKRAYRQKLQVYHPDKPETGNQMMYELIHRAAEDIGVA